MISKGKLKYDATTPGNGDQVAAFLRTSNGALTSETVGSDEALHVLSYLQDASGNILDSTDVSGTRGLNVNVLNDIEVSLDGVYNVSTNADPDNVGLIGHSRNASIGDAQQGLRLSGGAPSADDLDPADIQALDANTFLHGWDGSAWDRLTATSGALDVNISSASGDVSVVGNVADDAADSGNPVKVGYRAVDGALSALSATNDRADAISDLYRRLYVNTSPNISMQHGVQAVGTTALNLDATPLAGRRKIIVQNFSDVDVYIGDSGVTIAGATRGLLLPCGATFELEWGEDIPVYAITSAAAKDVMFMEVA